jgi:nitrate/TMAO reductase-like tetraheme cytochrome c subunit
MTNTTRRRNVRTCTDCHKQLNSSNCSPSLNAPDYCDSCFEVAGLENDHQDGYHGPGADGPHADCPMCTGVPIADASRKGHAGTTVARGSHADCYAAKAHDATKAGRAGCRKLKAAKA